jgi:hypothetical protein
MSGTLNDTDRRYLETAVTLSRGYLEDGRRWPFGAVVVGGQLVLGPGVYEQLRLPAESRSLSEVAEGNELREQAVAALRDWAQMVRRTASGTCGPLGYGHFDRLLVNEPHTPALGGQRGSQHVRAMSAQVQLAATVYPVSRVHGRATPVTGLVHDASLACAKSAVW